MVLSRSNNLTVAAVLPYCERFVELLIDLQSQLPTRKYTNALLIDLHTLVAIRLSPMYKDTKNQLFRDLVTQLEHYVYFSVNSYTSAPLSENEMHEIHCRELATLQRVSIQHFKDKLTVLALSNFASIDKRAELVELLSELTEEEIVRLCNHLNLRTSYPEGTKVAVDRDFLLEVLVETYQKRESFVEQARQLNVYPNDVLPFLSLTHSRNPYLTPEFWNTKISPISAHVRFPSRN
jgi:intron-binding protein aquarius